MAHLFAAMFALVAVTGTNGMEPANPLRSRDLAPINNCNEQAECVSFTVELITPSTKYPEGSFSWTDLGSGYEEGAYLSNIMPTDKVCTDCEYLVCMKLNLGGDCDKASTDTVSHTCVKPTDTCITTTGFYTPIGDEMTYQEAKEKSDINHMFTQCQIIGGGSAAEFLLKDGPGCGETDTATVSTSVGTAACRISPYASGNDCDNGTRNDGQCSCASSPGECVWTLEVPDCETTTTVATPPATTTTVATPPATTTTVATPPATTTTVATPPATTTTVATPPATTTTVATPPATTTSPAPVCGNNSVEAGEQCDDGGTDPGDGCDATCRIESPSGGDPHFTRWNQPRNSFHGECDLVMIQSDTFQGGFELQSRTTIDTYYSYIESAAFKTGNNIVEVEYDQLYFNQEPVSYANLPMTFDGITVTFEEQGPRKLITADLNGEVSLTFKFYKHYLNIVTSGSTDALMGSKGLLGSFPDGKMLDRAGNELLDFTFMGFEWQVHPEDSQLFHKARSPQLPYEKCRMPTAIRPARRRLRSNTELLNEAESACAHVTNSNYQLCVDDVMLTGDVGLAKEAW